MTKKAILLLANGFEEVEALTPADFLRRAEVELTIAAIGESLCVKGSHGIAVCADVLLAELAKQGKASEIWDAVIIPGGMPGASNLAESREVCALLTEMAAAGKLVCALCAAPAVVLSPLGLLKNRKFTCYPSYEKNVKDGTYSEESVVLDGNIITSRGPGTAAMFALGIIGYLVGNDTAKKIKTAALL
jgi:4-methyl-5(b-hydroxyethyl)-thiazole monophosphate biosynthesis